jgi:hypothetical protein
VNRRYLAFDIETAKILPEQVADLLSHRPLGIVCAAAVDIADPQQETLWHGKESGKPSPKMSRGEAQALVRDLGRFVADGYTLLTWNGLGFDFNVLAEESGLPAECAPLALAHVDMMFHVVCNLGHFLGLDKVAHGMGLRGKPQGMSGHRAPVLWASGHQAEVLQYAAGDCRMTAEVARAAEERGAIEWLTARGSRATMALPKGWLTAEQAMALPFPDTSWMRNPPSRESFTSWIRR